MKEDVRCILWSLSFKVKFPEFKCYLLVIFSFRKPFVVLSYSTVCESLLLNYKTVFFIYFSLYISLGNKIIPYPRDNAM